MLLTDSEKRILNGESGEGLQLAMEIMVSMCNALKAERLVDISSGHITMLEQQADHVYVMLADKMAGYGCKVCVPTTTNPSFIDYERSDVGSPEMVAPDHPLVEGFRRMNIFNSFTCTPFFIGNTPRCGEHIGWAEATAVAYANSVLGARTNPLPAMMDLVCAILGKAPYCGLHLDDNRRGQVLIEVDLDNREMTDLDFALMGFYTQDMAGEKIPVFDGVPANAPAGGLLGMGATIPSYMYHVVGVTPEAGTREQAFMGCKPELTLRFGNSEWSASQHKYGAVESSDVDIVMVGCPHCSLKQVVEYAGMLEGKKVSNNTEFLILTSNAVRHTVQESGYYDIIERSGAKLVNMCSLFTIGGDKPSKKVLTNSSTYRMYGPGIPMLASPDDCLQAALTGKFVPRR